MQSVLRLLTIHPLHYNIFHMSAINDFLIKSAAGPDMGHSSTAPVYAGDIPYPQEAGGLDLWERISLLQGGDRDNMHAASVGGTLGTAASLTGAGAVAVHQARRAIDQYGKKVETDLAERGKKTPTTVKVFRKKFPTKEVFANRNALRPIIALRRNISPAWDAIRWFGTGPLASGVRVLDDVIKGLPAQSKLGRLSYLALPSIWQYAKHLPRKHKAILGGVGSALGLLPFGTAFAGHKYADWDRESRLESRFNREMETRRILQRLQAQQAGQ